MVKFIFLMSITYLLLPLSAYSSYQKDICGKTDDRTLSYESEVGRALETLESTHGCTVTMISRSCAISAGHCYPVLKFVEFNTPPSENSMLQHSSPQDTYEVDASTLKWSKGFGTDYAVFKLLPNSLTGSYAGIKQGYKTVSFKKPRGRSLLKMYGYGASEDPSGNNAQQLSTGRLKKIKSNGKMYHKMDGAPGSSGSAIILEKSGEIVGIHTGNGCKDLYFANRATAISQNQQLQRWITECIQNDL